MCTYLLRDRRHRAWDGGTGKLAQVGLGLTQVGPKLDPRSPSWTQVGPKLALGANLRHRLAQLGPGPYKTILLVE